MPGFDEQGYIREWLMLAPIALPEERTAADLILREQVKDEAALRPREGDRLELAGGERTWTRVTAPTNYFDFNALLGSQNDHAAGFMVTYVESDREIRDVIIAVASNDQGRIYFNGIDIYAFTEPRPLTLDEDKGRVTLREGVNVIVFKIINQQNDWQGAMRLTDRSGNPLQGVRITLSPDGPPEHPRDRP